MKKIFTEYMFLLVLSTFGVYFIVIYFFGNNQSYGINKTVGWAYDISNQFFYNALIDFFSKTLFLIGYFLIFLFQRKTIYHISITHFCIIFLSCISIFFKNYIISTIFLLISIIVFFINALKSHKIKR